MNALEFNAKIEQGVIRLPKRFGEYDNTYVRIIILTNEVEPTMQKKSQLRAALQRLQENDLFPAISNPVDWQRKQRDEWE